MSKGERISRFVAELGAGDVDPNQSDIAKHPFYRAFFHCWNEQHYYEAHDVLEQLWLRTKSSDADYFKGLIQAAGAFVHLQKRFNIHFMPNTASVCLLRCVCSGSRRGTCRGSVRDITSWTSPDSVSFCTNTPIGSSHPITRPILGRQRRLQN